MLAMQFDPVTEDLIFGVDEYFKPQTVIAQSAEKAKSKIESVVEFGDWLKKNFPQVYEAVMTNRPELLVPEFAMSGLSGLGETDTSSPSTDWGKTLSDFINRVAAPLTNVYAQKRLIDLNISLAERGLPLVNSADLAPTVNVGISRDVKQIGIIAAIALGVGLFMLARKR